MEKTIEQKIRFVVDQNLEEGRNSQKFIEGKTQRHFYQEQGDKGKNRQLA